MNGDKSVIKLIRRKIYVIMALILLLIISLTSIIFFISQNKQNEYALIDVFGKQRMLTQLLAKDSNRKYAIMQSLERGPLVLSENVLNNRVESLNKSLNTAKNQFASTLTSLHSGKLQNDNGTIYFEKSLKEMDLLIDSTDKTWKEFKQSVNRIIDSQQIDEQTAEALIYINANNETLLQYCDQIIKGLISNQKKQMNMYMSIAIGLFFIALLLLLLSIVQLQKYMVIPLRELYKGINSIGLFKDNKSAIPTKNELIPVVKEIDESFSKLKRLVKLIENINQDMTFEGILKYIYQSFSTFIPYSHIGIALLKDEGQILEASYGISEGELNDLPKRLLGIKARIVDTSLGTIIQEGMPRVINDLDAYPKNRDSDYNSIIMDAGIKASITLPLKISNEPVGVIFFSSTEKNIYTEDHLMFLQTLSSSIAISLNKNIFIDELLFSTILALAKMAESRDEDTGDHLERMKTYSVKIAEYLIEDKKYCDEISVGFLKDIERFSPMHDIGKVGVRDGILLKPGKLTVEEFEDMKKHTVFGAEVLRTAEHNINKHNKSLFKMGIQIAEGHHEKWNGSGYPYGKSQEDIPLSARIVAVADVLDALTSKRPYKEAFSFEDSFNMIVKGKGTHFDPSIIDSFVRHKNDIFEVYKKFST